MSSDINILNSHILINQGDIIHDARDSKSQITREVLLKILPYVYTYLTEFQFIKDLKDINYDNINNSSHKIVKTILLDNRFGQQNRYRFTDFKNITIVSEITPVIFKKNIFSILPSEIIKSFNDNVNPAKYIDSDDLQIIDTPATYIDPATRAKDTFYFIPKSGIINIDTNTNVYNQKIKINFTSEFNKTSQNLLIKIKLTDERLLVSSNKLPLLSCKVDKTGNIIEFLKDNNVPTKNDDGNIIQYFSGNKQKNDYIQNKYRDLSPEEIKKILKIGSGELNKLLLLFACKELGDTMQSLVLKYFYENKNNNNVNEVKINNSCLFTSDTWCAARARLNKVPILLRNADKTLTIYSPLTEEEFVKSLIVTYVKNVIKNNKKILQFLKNVILKYNLEISGTTRRVNKIYKELIFETTQTNISIKYKENIRSTFIKIYIFIYFSIYISELIFEKNKTEILNIDKIKNVLLFIKATSPIISYNNGKEVAHLNGLITSIFNIKLYNSDNNNYINTLIGNDLISIIYNYSVNNNVNIPAEYYNINISDENTIKDFIDSIPNLNPFEFTKNDIIFNEGVGSYLLNLSQIGGMTPPISLNKKRSNETLYRTPDKSSDKSPNSGRMTKKRNKLNSYKESNNSKTLKRRFTEESFEENQESFNSKILKESNNEEIELLEKEFPDKIIYTENEVSLKLENFDEYNITTYSIYSILYNYLLQFPSLYTYFEENITVIISKILNYQDFITLEECIRLNEEYEIKTLEQQINSDNVEEDENYRDNIFYNFLNMINKYLINLSKKGGKSKNFKTVKKNKKIKKKRTKKRKKRKN